MSSSLKLVFLVALVSLATGGQGATADDNFCSGCRSFVSFARQFNSSSQRNDYKNLFGSYCELYYPVSTDFQEGPCPLFVEGLVYVLDHIDPIHHCDQIGACDPAGKPSAGQPSDDIYEYMRGNHNNNIRPPGLVTRGDNVVCEFCEQIVRQAKDALNDPAAINQMKQQLDGLCDFLTVVGKEKECRQYVDKYIDQAIDFIKNIDPKGYCSAISLCSTGQDASAKWALAQEQTGRNRLANLPSLADFQNFGIETSVLIGEKAAKAVAPAAAATRKPSSKVNKLDLPECGLCKTVIKELFNFLHDNKTEANIIEGLERVCSLVYSPGTKRDECDSMIKAYTREIVQLMIDETNPEMICMLLGFCAYGVEENPSTITKTLLPTISTSSDTFEMADLISSLDNNVGYKSPEACFECKMFIKFLRQKIDEPRTQEGIKDWLQKNLCKNLPGQNLVDSCSSLVEQNSATFFKAVEGAMNPTSACRELGVCGRQNVASVFNVENSSLEPGLHSLPMIMSIQRTSSPAETAQRISQRPKEFRGQMCDQCVNIVSQIDEYLSSHPVDQDVSQIIDRVCNKLPEGTARDECTYIIKMFGAEIVQAISTMDNPRQLCSKIYLCQAN